MFMIKVCIGGMGSGLRLPIQPISGTVESLDSIGGIRERQCPYNDRLLCRDRQLQADEPGLTGQAQGSIKFLT
jgi:hypothetical protein